MVWLNGYQSTNGSVRRYRVQVPILGAYSSFEISSRLHKTDEDATVVETVTVGFGGGIDFLLALLIA